MKTIKNCLLLLLALFISTDSLAMRMAYKSPVPRRKIAIGAVKKGKQLEAVVQLTKEKKCQNLICIFDALNDETVFGDNSAMVFTFIDALRQKVAPIIITTNTVERFCYWKTHFLELAKHTKFRGIAPIVKTSFDQTEWHCFGQKQSGLMLLMPKNYLQKHANSGITDLGAQMAYCGFDVSGFEEVVDLSPATALEYIQKHERGYEKVIDDFESMFIKNTDWLPYVPQWNIYVIGHGGHVDIDVKKKGISRGLLDLFIVEAQERLQEAINDPREFFPAFLGEMKKEDVIKQRQYRVDELKFKRQQNQLYDEVRGVRGQIAGLPYADFAQLISFFEKGIKTSYLHYASCFSGGSNQALVSKELSEMQASFIVSTQGVNESTTSSSSYSGNFTPFFAACQNFFCASDQVVATRKSQWFSEKDPIASIVTTVIDKATSDKNQPFVRIPKIGVFNALVVDKQVKLLTNAIARAHELEGTLIDYSDSAIKTILVYPFYVGVPLKVNSHVAFVSPSPQSVKPIQTIHIFENIVYPRVLSSVIANFVSFNTRYEPITFVIKKLRCFDYANSGLGVGDKHFMDISDLIIHITSVKRPDINDLDVVVDALFTFNDKHYLLSTTINELQNSKQPNIERLFTQLKAPVILLNQTNLTNLAQKILNTQEIENNIVPSRIVELLQEKIGQATRVEKIGELKYAFVLKKIDSLERAVTQEALTQQKAHLQHNNQPVAALVSSLQKLINAASQLLVEINQLTVEQLSSELIAASPEQVEANRNYLKARVVKAQELLDKEYELAASQLTWSEYAATIIQPGVGAVHNAVRSTVRGIGELSPWLTIRKNQLGKKR